MVAAVKSEHMKYPGKLYVPRALTKTYLLEPLDTVLDALVQGPVG